MDRYVSVDWGRKMDHTAITYVQRQGEHQHWTFSVEDATRYPLGTKFHDVLDDLRTRSGPPGWEESDPTLITDASGIGDVLLEDMRRAEFNPIGIIITAGGSASQDERDYKLWHVARNILVDTLRSRLGASLNLHHCPTAIAVEIAAEAANMAYTITQALNQRTEPRQGKHDDLLLSLAMAVWYGANQGPPAEGLTPVEIAAVQRAAGHPSASPLQRLWSRRPW